MRKFTINKFTFDAKAEDGQTLIETIVAMFILVTAIVSCLALAIFAIQSSSSSKNQVIALNLAREGIDVVRMMRDSNWLSAEDIATVDDLQVCTYPNSVQHACYPDAFALPYVLGSSTQSDRWRLVLRTIGNSTSWQLDLRNGIENYMLCVQADGTYQHNHSNGTMSCNEEGQFARKIRIQAGSQVAPYTTYSATPDASATGGHSPQLLVTSTVIWKGRGCVDFLRGQNPETLTSTKCRVQITESLTNWKDYK